MLFLSESISPYIFKKQNKSTVCTKDDIVEKGETDSFRKENVLSRSEDEEKYNNPEPKEKRFKQDYHLNSFAHQKSIYTKTTTDEKNGVKIVTSVSVTGDSSPNITFQQSQEPLSENQIHSPIPVTNILNINCTGSHLKLQLNTSGNKTTLVFMNKSWSSTEVFKSKCEETWMPDNESSEQPLVNVTDEEKNHNNNDKDHTGTTSKQTEPYCDSKCARSANIWDSPDCSQCCSDDKQQGSGDFKLADHLSSPPLLLNIKPQGKRQSFHTSLSSGDEFWHIPPPQEFADIKNNSLEGLTQDLASCRINTSSPAVDKRGDLHLTSTEELKCLYCAQEEERGGLPPSFDELSQSDNYDPVFTRPLMSTNRSSFMKDFINSQKRKSWIRNNSIATVEHKVCSLPKKRRQTFPGMSQGLGLMQEDLQLHYRESFSSLVMCSLPLQTERLERTEKGDDRLSAFGLENDTFSQTKGSLKQVSEILDSHDRAQPFLSPFYVTGSEINPEIIMNTEHCQRHDFNSQHDTNLSIYKDMESLDTDDCEYTVDQCEVADSGFEQEFGEGEYHCPEPLTEELTRRAFSIQVIPPSCSGSEEHMLQSHPEILSANNEVKNANQKDSVSFLPGYSNFSVQTITDGAFEPSLLQRDSQLSLDSCLKRDFRNAVDDPCMSLLQDLHVESLNLNEVTEDIKPKPTSENTEGTDPILPLINEGTDYLELDTENSRQPASISSGPVKDFKDTEVLAKETLSKTNRTEKQIVSKCKLFQFIFI